MASRRDQDQIRKLVVRGMGWCLCVTLWTFALVTIYPVQLGESVTPKSLHFPAAKFLHVTAYAFLVVYLKWLPLGRGRWPLLAFLSLHAFGTEFCQLYVPGRHGTITDVLIDHLGLVLGMVLTRKCWLPRFCRPPIPSRPEENPLGLTRSSPGHFRVARSIADNADRWNG